MSLFGSLYDEEADDDADEAPAPAADLDIDAPSMSLQDFAAQTFGDSDPDDVDGDDVDGDDVADDTASSAEPISIEVADPDPEAEPEIEVPDLEEPAPAGAWHEGDETDEPSAGFSSLFGGDDAPSPPDDAGPAPADAPGETSPETAPTTPQPAGALASAASDLADLAKSPVATLDPPETDDDTGADDEPSPGLDELDTTDSDDGPVDFGEPLLIDDLLPSAKPGGGTNLPSLSAGIPMRLVAVLLVAALAGYLGMRMLGGGSGGDATADSSGSAEAAAPADDPGSEIPRSPGEVLDRAQEAGAEVELRNAAIAAQAEYANSGTFARSAADWDALVPQARVQGASTPTGDVLSVVSDDDAVCFETLLQNGTTAAAGVTAATMGFDQDPGGASICTADAAVIEGWAPSLSGL